MFEVSRKYELHGSEVIRKWFGLCNTPFPEFAVEFSVILPLYICGNV